MRATNFNEHHKTPTLCFFKPLSFTRLNPRPPTTNQPCLSPHPELCNYKKPRAKVGSRTWQMARRWSRGAIWLYSSGVLRTGRLTRIIGWNKCKWRGRPVALESVEIKKKIIIKEHNTNRNTKTLTQKSVKDISNCVFSFASVSQMEHHRRCHVLKTRK